MDLMQILGDIITLIWVIAVSYTMVSYWKLRTSDWSDL